MRDLPKNIYLRKQNKKNPYFVKKVHKNKQHNLGYFPTIEAAEQAIKDFDEDPEEFIQFLELNRASDHKYIVVSEKSYIPYKYYKNKKHHLGSFTTLEEAQQALKDFDDDPEAFIQFLEMDRKRDLPKNITFVSKHPKNPYFVSKQVNNKRYRLGVFSTIEEAEQVLAEFNANPAKWAKKQKPRNKRDLPISIYKNENLVNPYYSIKYYKGKQYYLGVFSTIELAEQVLAEFNADPDKWIKENR